LFGELMVAMDDVWVKGELYRLSHELRARANAERNKRNAKKRKHTANAELKATEKRKRSRRHHRRTEEESTDREPTKKRKRKKKKDEGKDTQLLSVKPNKGHRGGIARLSRGRRT
jgi:hypothetical protein